MKVSEVMTPELVVVDAASPIQEAAAKMKDRGVGCLPVVEDGRLAGILTDRDIVLRFVAEGLDYSGTTASDVMTREVITCAEDDDVEDARRAMEREYVRRLVVVDAQGRAVGIISSVDIAAPKEEGDHETQPRGQGRPQFPGPG